jgi:hypothetical protein
MKGRVEPYAASAGDSPRRVPHVREDSIMKLISRVAIAALAVLLAPAVQAQAPNDSCATAIAIGDGLFPGNNLLATTGPDPVGSCGAMGNDVWYAYTASCNGIATAEFCGAGSATYDTVITAWSGACGALTEIVCNDDWCGLQSHITFGVTSGTVYYISVGGFSNSTGNFSLSIFCTTPSGNDTCSGAITINSSGAVTSGSNLGATTGIDPVVGNCGFANGGDVWFVLNPTCSGNFSATTCDPSTNFDTVIGIWDGTAGCGNLIPVACNDNDPTGCPTGGTFGQESRVVWSATPGVTYYISVAGVFGASGSFGLSVTCVTPVGNDNCTGAISITEGVPVLGSNIGSTTGPEPVQFCGGMANDVWYVVVASCSGPYTATTCQAATAYDTTLAIWDGTAGCSNLVAINCNDDSPIGCSAGQVFGLESWVTWTATAGTPYYISVAGFVGNMGNFGLLVSNGTGLTLTFTNNGPGTIGYQVVGGSPNGATFTAVTLSQGAYPSAWFFGIDISFPELMNEVNTGFPFLIAMDPCGSGTVGPFGGLPTGLTVYGVSLGIPLNGGFPTVISPPATASVP